MTNTSKNNDLPAQKKGLARARTKPRVYAPLGGPSLTHQSFQQECDINNIMRNYQKTGLINHLSKHSPSYGDFISSSDYRENMDHILAASDAFNALPALLRKRFNNDPAEFLAFVEDGNNLTEMAQLGLLNEDATKRALESLSAGAASNAPGGVQIPNDDPTPNKAPRAAVGPTKTKS